MADPDKRNDSLGVWRALALPAQIGLMMGGSILGAVLLGQYFDRKVGGHGLVLAGAVLIGVGIGGYGVYRALTREGPWNR